MRILVDAMSGDNAPLEILKGTAMAAAEFSEDTFILVGNEGEIQRIAQEAGISLAGMTVRHTEGIVTMNDDPIASVRNKKDSSMMVALRMLADGEGDVVVSAGNTGALFTGASLIVRKLKGISRAAIGTVLPFKPPVLLLDSGANLVINEDIMVQFAHMGTAYMKKMYGLNAPRVGILNNGEEECKGLPLQIESYKRLQAEPGVNFVGNIESNRLMKDTCDVILTDGFSGNILLKMVEGMGKMLLGVLKGIFYQNFFTKLAALIVKKPLGAMKKDFDPAEHGGAPILGLAKPVIKAHGSSNAKAFKNAIRQAIQYTNSGVTEDIARNALAFETERKAKAAAAKQAVTAEEKTDDQT